ncbi:vWA domain-containing protein [Denitrobaculum tricleocarpae]|uniref:VWA domain-containing protein n=1 Tax=Denitrobaculum tricleocarpae TaxID=2591009 RepID=A0A545TY38_9PROT|nr:VWA domain-containing protein [Denitrobaculum tricleocarpae]TQV82138.1 VWA domain-containing protein [Denitrobaculum tricleocarpae]
MSGGRDIAPDGTIAERDGGKFAENIMHFARVLRRAGLPVGPGKVVEALRAVETAGLQRREDFYWTLHAVFVNRRDQRELFDQTFHIFWRNPELLEKMMSMLLPTTFLEEGPEQEREKASRRVSDAMAPESESMPSSRGEEEGETIEIDATLTYSDEEHLRHQDFESMSSEEVALAKKAIAKLRLPIVAVPTRRFKPHVHGHKIDMRRSLRASLRSGGDSIPLRRKARAERHPPLVVLCDISGSMSQYSRMFLHFLHAITNDRDRVHTFLFGTRLTNVTRYLRTRDVDVALEKIGENVDDWSGGTRIGQTLAEFNVKWSRRVLGQGAMVLFISDGLDRDAGSGLGEEMERLHKSCRRLIWLNPLLRYEGFEPKSKGIRAILPHVDDFRSVHSLNSLEELAAILSQPPKKVQEGHFYKAEGNAAA